MWALAMNGQRERAMQQYESLCENLSRELGILPLVSTRRLYEQIRSGGLPVQQSLVSNPWGIFSQFAPVIFPTGAAFVGREPELVQLNRFLEDTLAGQGRLIFLSGEAGSGKTTLMNEFVHRAREAYPDLLVACGNCCAYFGQGDPYQPFRELLESFTEDLKSLNVKSPGVSFWNQEDLFGQVTRLLLEISRRSPILLLLDDLQWMDRASANLLFHLGSYLSGKSILLLGSYRVEEIAFEADGNRHCLASILNEFQRRFGEIQIDLSQADGHAFVNAYLDSEPNLYDQDFRKTLYRYSGGSPLFTVELLQGMQDRGEVVQDEASRWVQCSNVNWERLPARVEAVLAEQCARLDDECLTLLEAASVQGEVFNAGVLARILGVTEDEVTTRLSGPLCKRYHLVDSLGLLEQGSASQAQYRFRNLLFQKYLYMGLDEVERARWQRSLAEAD